MKVEYIPRRALYQKHRVKTSFSQHYWQFKIEIPTWQLP
jgi:hypothetical protein